MGNNSVKESKVTTDKESVPVIHVDYCNSWGYHSKYMSLKEIILKSYPKAQITSGTSKERGGFEVTVNDKLIHSKTNGDGLVSNTDDFITKIKQVTESS